MLKATPSQLPLASICGPTALIMSLVLIALTACEQRQPANQQTQLIHAGNASFRVPAEYLASEPASARSAEGGIQHAILAPRLVFPIDDPADAQDPTRDDVATMVLSAKSDENAEALWLRAREAREATGPFQGRRVEQGRHGRFVRVYQPGQDRRTWQVFLRSTDDRLAVDEWIAECAVPAGEREHEGLTNVTCTTVVELDDIVAWVTFPGSRLRCHELIRTRVRELLNEWLV